MSDILVMLKRLRVAVIAVLSAALLASFCVGGCAALPDASAFQIPKTGCALYVDLDNTNMIVFLNGKPVKAYPVSGGTRESPSPVGTWKVTDISSWGGVFGGSWIGLNVPWGIYGIHGAVQPWTIGEYNASHGCIRMQDADVMELRSMIRPGTVVYIKNDLMPFRAMKNGMIGSDVQKTQRMLKSLGYDAGAADGKFGSAMERAVRKFQKASQLTEDGVVGRRTYEKICALLK